MASHFRDFPDSDCCGFTIAIINGPIALRNDFLLDMEVETENGKSKKFTISLDLTSSGIQEIEVFEDAKHAEQLWTRDGE